MYKYMQTYPHLKARACATNLACILKHECACKNILGIKTENNNYFWNCAKCIFNCEENMFSNSVKFSVH